MGIIELITDFIKEMLRGWVLSNLGNMFTDINDKVGTVATEVGKTPSTWNSNIYTMVHNISDSVMIPIAGMIISAVLCYELITMIMDKNNMHDFDTSLFIRYLAKACIAVMLLSKTFDITMAIFDLGNHVVTQAAGVINANATLDVESALITLFNNSVASMEIGELLALGMETMIISFGMEIISVIITVILFGRMIEIYLYISVAPVPFATLGNREWGNIGTNYLKALVALAFQGFFIMVCVGIYAALVASVTVANNIHTALWSIVAYTIVLCYSMLKTSSLSRSIFHAH